MVTCPSYSFSDNSQASIARGGDAARSDCLIEVADIEQVVVVGRLLLGLDLIEEMGSA